MTAFRPRSCQLFLLAASLWLCVGGAPRAAEPAPVKRLPHWIWVGVRPTDSDAEGRAATARLEKRFSPPGAIETATLHVAADFCRATIELNGRAVLCLEAYSPTVEMDVTPYLAGGENRLAISADHICGPRAVALSLSLKSAAGEQTVLSDDTWTIADATGNAVSVGPVEPELWGVGRRSAALSSFDNYEQWQIAKSAGSDAARFSTAPGFQIRLLREALPEEGSWVSLTFDPQGRLTIARELKGLLRMTLDEARQSIAKVETINDELLECRGLLYAYGALYANANNSRGMYRLRDTDGDDQFDEVKLLREFPGKAGHGRNDLALGPDGLIYSMHGDAVDYPTANIADRTSPLRDARRGQQTSEGHLVRTDRNGERWEIVCSGLRNPYGIAFNPAGDLFTYDADAEFDMGTPWYRPTRVVQLVSGADYGWRGVTGKWPPYFPDHADNALPTLDIGRGSPTAVAFGTKSAFPRPYQDALYILDWAYGRLLAIHMQPRGAGYRAQAETFLQGRPLNLTDLVFGPDGALYVVTGGRKTHSALYKVTYNGPPVAQTEPSAHSRQCAEHATLMRSLRERLEAYHGHVDSAALDAAWPHLDSPDPSIRHAARIAIEQQPFETWRDRALAERRTTAALTALLALARSGGESSAVAIFNRLHILRAEEFDLGQSFALVEAYLLRDHVPVFATILEQDLIPHRAAAVQHVSPWGNSAKLERDVARLLAQSRSPRVFEKALPMLASPQQEDRLQGLFVLRHVRDGWTLENRRAYFTVLNEAANFVQGEGMPRFIAQLREESLATLTDAERSALADLLAPPAEAAPAEPPPPRSAIKQWSIDDFASLLSAASRSGDATRGASVFRDALCARCHRVGARGPAVGPDLTYVARRFSRRDMLESILTPSKVVAENYRNVQVVAKDGRVIVGRVVVEGDFRSQVLRILTDPLRPASVVEIDKREMEDFRIVETSPMPQSLLDGFRPEEILDLLAYLEQGAK